MRKRHMGHDSTASTVRSTMGHAGFNSIFEKRSGEVIATNSAAYRFWFSRLFLTNEAPGSQKFRVLFLRFDRLRQAFSLADCNDTERASTVGQFVEGRMRHAIGARSFMRLRGALCRHRFLPWTPWRNYSITKLEHFRPNLPALAKPDSSWQRIPAYLWFRRSRFFLVELVRVGTSQKHASRIVLRTRTLMRIISS